MMTKQVRNIFARIARCVSATLLPLLLLPVLHVNRLHAQDNVVKTARGVDCRVGDVHLELAVPATGVFRLSLARNAAPHPADSVFLARTNPATVSWQMVKRSGWVGVRAAAGELLVDPRSSNWTLKDANGKVLIPSHPFAVNPEKAATSDSLTLALGRQEAGPVQVYGCGNGVDSLQQSNVTTQVGNGLAVIPYYWSPAGYAALAVTADDNQPARWKAAKNGKSIQWTFPGNTADLYLMPAANLKLAAEQYAALTGHAPVPPRWAFGYLQSRWGWKNRAYIEDTLKQFQQLHLPVDAFIYDFEWYTVEPDYAVKPKGETNFDDFGWNAKLFPHPAAQIADYKQQGVHFVGIRKPRLGNAGSLAMLRAKHWNLKSKGGGQFHARDMDFANPDLRRWYAAQTIPLLKAGIDGFWNDEGEGSYTTYFYWNEAETLALKQYEPDHRLWTLNRAFSPGMQRLGASAWTGDIKSKWSVLAETPTSLLNWGLAGMPYSACDIGGFDGNPSPELLTRWMQAGVFFPIMRTHSSIQCKPHFPWLYGTNALDAMRDALDLRYRLIPYYYSLAHDTFAAGLPLMRPLVMEFPDDPQVVNLSSEWMMGDSLLAAPVLQKGGRRRVYLPAGDWYVFDSNAIKPGNQNLRIHAALDKIPVYVRAGSILPLAPVLQHTSELPGGALELQIYPGKDATFTLFEDDGKTLDYQHGQVRRTTFVWHDTAGRLTWKRAGNYDGADVFKKLHITLFDPQKKVEKATSLTAQGALDLRAAR